MSVAGAGIFANSAQHEPSVRPLDLPNLTFKPGSESIPRSSSSSCLSATLIGSTLLFKRTDEPPRVQSQSFTHARRSSLIMSTGIRRRCVKGYRGSCCLALIDALSAPHSIENLLRVEGGVPLRVEDELSAFIFHQLRMVVHLHDVLVGICSDRGM